MAETRLAPWQTALLAPSAQPVNEAWARIPAPSCRHDNRRLVELLEGLADDFDNHPPADPAGHLRRVAELLGGCCS